MRRFISNFQNFVDGVCPEWRLLQPNVMGRGFWFKRSLYYLTRTGHRPGGNGSVLGEGPAHFDLFSINFPTFSSISFTTTVIESGKLLTRTLRKPYSVNPHQVGDPSQTYTVNTYKTTISPMLTVHSNFQLLLCVGCYTRTFTGGIYGCCMDILCDFVSRFEYSDLPFHRTRGF